MLVETMLSELRPSEIISLQMHPESQSVGLLISNGGLAVDRMIAVDELNAAESDVFAETFRRALDELRGAS